jgi:hypothetical protein
MEARHSGLGGDYVTCIVMGAGFVTTRLAVALGT